MNAPDLAEIVDDLRAGGLPRQWLTAAKIASWYGIAKSTARRRLDALHAAGIVVRNGTYRPATRGGTAAQVYRARLPVEGS